MFATSLSVNLLAETLIITSFLQNFQLRQAIQYEDQYLYYQNQKLPVLCCVTGETSCCCGAVISPSRDNLFFPKQEHHWNVSSFVCRSFFTYQLYSFPYETFRVREYHKQLGFQSFYSSLNTQHSFTCRALLWMFESCLCYETTQSIICRPRIQPKDRGDM